MLITLALSLILAQSPAVLPRVVPPPGFTGGADVAALEPVLARVISGRLPDDYMLEDARPWTAEEIARFMLNFQSPQPVTTIEPGAPIFATWTWTPNPARPVSFRLWRDGEIIKNFTTADLTVSGTSPQTFITNAGVIPPFTAAQRGARTLSLTAYDPACEAAQQQGCESNRARVSITVQVGFTSPPPDPGGFAVKVGGQ